MLKNAILHYIGNVNHKIQQQYKRKRARPNGKKRKLERAESFIYNNTIQRKLYQ